MAAFLSVLLVASGVLVLVVLRDVGERLGDRVKHAAEVPMHAAITTGKTAPTVGWLILPLRTRGEPFNHKS